MNNEISVTIENIEEGFLLVLQHNDNTYGAYGEKKFFIKDEKAILSKLNQELKKILKC